MECIFHSDWDINCYFDGKKCGRFECCRHPELRDERRKVIEDMAKGEVRVVQGWVGGDEP